MQRTISGRNSPLLTMQETLQTAMNAVEQAPHSGYQNISGALRFSVLAGLGSKYLAVGTPASLGIVGCVQHRETLIACHALLFGNIATRDARDLGIEAAMASDIVCLGSGTEFLAEWIAEATHLNILEDAPWSPGMRQLSQSCALTRLESKSSTAQAEHDCLSEVILGSASGRVGEEITALLIGG